MANFTEKAIKASFIKLLNEKPMSKISVKDIVEDCGINRNSFYYHFQDIPALLEQIVAENTAAIIEKYPTIDSLDDCFAAACQFALENRRAAFHIYNSVRRDMFERELMNICEYVVKTYLQTVFPDVKVNESDRQVLLRFIKCELFGIAIEWMENGMKTEAVDDLHRIVTLCRGFSEEIIERSKI
ncbi:MAG: TetR family transcriptional regulator [Firmicutes bacterium]|nr:TetR family transcriptional regulator [Bacillota bacterium]